MADTAWDLTDAANRLHKRFGTNGRPKFLGVERIEGVGIVAMWDDGSLAVATFVGGSLAHWKALPSPDYDALFGERVAVETMPDD